MESTAGAILKSLSCQLGQHGPADGNYQMGALPIGAMPYDRWLLPASTAPGTLGHGPPWERLVGISTKASRACGLWQGPANAGPFSLIEMPGSF